MVALSPLQIVLENCPFRTDIMVYEGNKSREDELDHLQDCVLLASVRAGIVFFKDETILGIKDIRTAVTDRWKALIPKRIIQPLRLVTEIEALDKREVSDLFDKVIEKLENDDFILSEKERKVFLKIFREPYNHLREIEELYNRIISYNKYILSKLFLDLMRDAGVNFEISPVATLFTLEKLKLSNKQKLALLFFTNINWYKKEVAPILFLKAISYLRDISIEELVKNTNLVFWIKMKNHLETFINFYKKRLFVLAHIGEPSAFEVCFLTSMLSLREISSREVECVKKLVDSYKRGWNS